MIEVNQTPTGALRLPTSEQQLAFPVFNDKYHILHLLGEGLTAKVFLAREIESEKQVAIKFITKSHLNQSNRIADFRKEIDILSKLDHHGIVKMIEAGEDGILISKNHRVQYDVSFIVMDYYRGEFFNFCTQMGPMDEQSGKFFLNQLCETL